MKYLEKLNTLNFYLSNPKFIKWRKYEFNHNAYLNLNKSWLQKYKFDTVLDIGANLGQSAIALSYAFPGSVIHSFEPIPECFKILKEVSNQLPNVTVNNFALGEEKGEYSFRLNEYSASSSLLTIAEGHVRHFPHTSSTTETKVNVVKLDDYVKEADTGSRILIKMDVQGFEKQVILGGFSTFSSTSVVILETSFEILYDSQSLFNDIYELMKEMGFVYVGSFDQLLSPTNGKILQQDAIFTNSLNR